MPKEIEELSYAIANGNIIDDYSLWRIAKDVESEIYNINRAKEPLPFEIVRLRAILRRARALRKNKPVEKQLSQKKHNEGPQPHLRHKQPQLDAVFDPFEFVARYRNLGGLRVATGWGEKIRIHLWNEETPEAAEFWQQRFNALSLRHQNMVAASLLDRGRF